MNTSPLFMLVAGLMSVFTWAVTRKVLKDHSTLSCPPIPVCVAGLSFVGLVTLEDQWRDLLTSLYAALAVALLLLLVGVGVFGASRNSNNRTSGHYPRSSKSMSDEEEDQETRADNREKGNRHGNLE